MSMARYATQFAFMPGNRFIPQEQTRRFRAFHSAAGFQQEVTLPQPRDSGYASRISHHKLLNAPRASAATRGSLSSRSLVAIETKARSETRR
jgi:hypothetical protein